MFLAIMDTISHVSLYAAPPLNYIGAAFFLTYILLALIFTFFIILSLYQQYISLDSSSTIPKSEQNARKRHIQIYAFLASIGFSNLSYNMLGFLIQELTIWAQRRNILGMRVGWTDLGSWMLETCLFEGFAKELVSSKGRALWTQGALVVTWYWNAWMGKKGTFPTPTRARGKFGHKILLTEATARQHTFTIRQMLPFLLLSQILPISFTACLFIIQLHLSAMKSSSFVPASQQDEKDKAINSTSSQQQVKLSSLILPTLLINVTLLVLPTLRSHPMFIDMVLFTRLLLLIPHSERVRLGQKDLTQSLAITTGFVVANYAMMEKTGDWGSGVGVGAKGSWAVRTLTWDAIIGAVVAAVLRWGGGV